MSTTVVAEFVQKIFHIINDQLNHDVIDWNEIGDAFIIHNEYVFSSNVLQTYFKHSNFSSFIRQLNLYGFRRRKQHEFGHPFFHRGHPEQLPLITRRKYSNSTSKIINDLMLEITTLQRQYHELLEHQVQEIRRITAFMSESSSGCLPCDFSRSHQPDRNNPPRKRSRHEMRSIPEEFKFKIPNPMMV